MEKKDKETDYEGFDDSIPVPNPAPDSTPASHLPFSSSRVLPLTSAHSKTSTLSDAGPTRVDKLTADLVPTPPARLPSIRSQARPPTSPRSKTSILSGTPKIFDTPTPTPVPTPAPKSTTTNAPATSSQPPHSKASSGPPRPKKVDGQAPDSTPSPNSKTSARSHLSPFRRFTSPSPKTSGPPRLKNVGGPAPDPAPASNSTKTSHPPATLSQSPRSKSLSGPPHQKSVSSPAPDPTPDSIARLPPALPPVRSSNSPSPKTSGPPPLPIKNIKSSAPDNDNFSQSNSLDRSRLSQSKSEGTDSEIRSLEISVDSNEGVKRKFRKIKLRKKKITFASNQVGPHSTARRPKKSSLRSGSDRTGNSSSIKSIGPLGWNAGKSRRRNAVFAGSPYLLFRTVDETQNVEELNPDTSHPGVLAAEIRNLRNKRKVKIRRYWNKVLETVQAVEIERRAHKSHIMDDAYDFKKRARKSRSDDDYDDDDKDNPWNAESIAKETNFTQWLLRARSTLPSARHEFHDTTILEGKFYRQFKAAGDLVYAKCALTDDDEERLGDFNGHMKEAADPQNTRYRKNFNYFDHLNKIKSFPTTLNKKKLMYRYLNNEVEEFRKTETEFKLAIYPRWHRFYTKVSGVFNDFAPAFHLWRVPINNMFAYFGSEVLNYFLVTRRIVVLEVVQLIVFFAVLIIPGYQENGGFTEANRTNTFKLQDILHGAGWFQNSLMYYGGYPMAKNISGPVPLRSITDSGTYRLILFWQLLWITNTTLIVIRIFKSYSQSTVISDRSKKTLSHFNTAFCSWEFSVNSIQLAASAQESIVKKFSLLSQNFEHGEDLKAYNYDDDAVGRDFKRFLSKNKNGRRKKIFHAFVNFMTVFIAISSSIVLVFLVELKVVSNGVLARILSKFLTFFELGDDVWFFLPGLYFSILFNLVSPIIVYLSDLELWHRRRVRNYYVIGRLCFIYVANYLAIFGFWINISHEWSTQTERCYETEMGILFYNIIVWEFIFSLVYSLLKDVLLNFALWKFGVEYTAPVPSMDIPVTSLLFRHALICLIGFFAPILVLVSLMITVANFYIKKTILTWIFSHPKYFAHVSDYEHPYFLGSFIFFCVQCFCNLHLLSRGYPSLSCGSMRSAGKVRHFQFYSSFAEDFLTYYPVRYYLYEFFENTTIGFSWLIILGGAVFIVRKWGQAYLLTLDVNRTHLQLEKKDRAFLLRAIYDYSKSAHNLAKEGEEDISISAIISNEKVELDQRNVFRTKARAVGALISAGKRRALSRQYTTATAIRTRLIKEFEANRPANETADAKLARLYQLKEELMSELLTPTKEAVEARRQSMAAKFLRNTDAIRLIHKAERQERQQMWEARGRSEIMQNIGKAKT